MSFGENSTPLRVVPKTNYIGTNFLDAREFSEGSPETVVAKKCWVKVDKYLSLETMLTRREFGVRTHESDVSQLNGLMFVHCEKSNKREPSQR